MEETSARRRKTRWVAVLVGCLLLLFLAFIYAVNYGMSIGRAASQGNLPEVMRIVGRNPRMVNSYPDGATPLHYAAANGHLEVVKYLVEKGADVSRANENGLTAEQWARQKGHLDVAEYLRHLSDSEEQGQVNNVKQPHAPSAHT